MALDETRPFIPVNIAVLTVSDTRTAADDRSGDTLAERILKAGHRVAVRAIEKDETAAIEALDALKRPCRVELHTDSQYVRNGITQWLSLWKARGWKTMSKGAVKNEDLWRRLDEARLRHEVDWRWVKGHAGHALNERADGLARRGERGRTGRSSARGRIAARGKTDKSFFVLFFKKELLAFV